MTARTTWTAGAPALLLILALTGCASGGGDGGDDGAEPAAQEVELGPLDEYFQKAYGEYDEDQAARDMRRVEEVVAACMAEEGFDYTPMDTSQMVSGPPEDLDVEWGTLEFAEQYGYGITTNPYGDPAESMPQEEFVDPNAEYVESMSQSEQEAYFVALHGDQVFPEDGESGEDFVYDWTQNGCQGRAQHEVYEGGEAGDAVTSLQEEMNAVWEQTQQDPRVVEATTAWVSCMGDAGITGLTTVDEAQMRISDQANAVYEEVYNNGDMAAEMPTPEDVAELETQVKERLGAITEEEIDTAVADFECREDVGYDDTFQEVGHDLQQQFVDTHREELDAWVEAVSAARS
jgi:hypothetical protein